MQVRKGSAAEAYVLACFVVYMVAIIAWGVIKMVTA